MQFARWLSFICVFGFVISSLAGGQDLSDLVVSTESPTSTVADTETDARDTADKGQEDDAPKQDQAQEKRQEEEKTPQKPQLRQINLSGNYVDLVQPMSLDPTSLILGSNPLKQKSFYRLCKFIDDLADDERFSYVVFDLSARELQMNSAQLDELARRLKNLSDSGKRTFAWLEDASNVHLSIAASCDEVILAELGGVDMPSVAMQSMFYRDAMDLVGVKASVVRAGDFKGAVEPFMNSQMSDHLREHYVTMLTSMNEALVDRIARGRGLKHPAVRQLQSKRMLLPQAALSAGLVDRIAPYGSMRKAIQEEIGESIEWVTPKTDAKKQMSIFQLMGQIMAGPTTSSGRLRENTIAVLHLSGAIVDGKKATPGNIVSGPTVDLIEQLAAEEKVKGVVVRINSPGGSATASEAVRQALVNLNRKKPTVVSMGAMAASGGYWVSCIDAPIYAEKATLTGSIGVFSMKLSVGALMRRVGVNLESITLDDSANLFSLNHAWTDKDNELLQETIDLFYDRFLKLVGESRGIKEKKLRKIAGGRVWSGEQAKKLQLVDHLGGLDDCLAAVSKKTKLEDYNIIHRPVPRSGLDLSELLGAGGEEEIWSEVPAATLRLLRQRGFSLNVLRVLLADALKSNGKPTTWALAPVEFSIQ